ncbi:C40 family peptidase [Aureibacillus halotolerans]|uniref:Cell wall-associated NlpC family hydrolase n=1 Tax=Aureibacillus halotolerans TaxID=1508390 RepID=A0A4R6TS72_9BACI|nr:C40 family peptidase [Aureibacillus halotolerans]TDQ36131.1 cell wall-associated NlpC family hydrolase [Aureibacillus halotolerans]
MFKKIATGIAAFTMAATLFMPAADAAASSNIVSTAKNYIGTPYAYGGTSASGFDCSGYVLTVLGAHNVDLPRTTGGQFASGTAVSKADLQSGDLVFFNTSGRGVSHSGIYIGNGQFIHSASSNGVSISDLNDPYYWGSRYIGARRVLN